MRLPCPPATHSGLSFSNGALDCRRLPPPFPLPTSTISSRKSTPLCEESIPARTASARLATIRSRRTGWRVILWSDFVWTTSVRQSCWLISRTLSLATQIQSKLLPPRDIALESWDTQYRYEPVGAVGGDYCELIVPGDGKSLFFAVGDVAGKGVAASLLMTHLSAIFRSLLSLDLPLADVVSRANRLFCESTAPAHYATLVCGRATANGVELCNAGHCTPLLLQRDATQRLDSTGLPLGLFCGGQYTVRHISLGAGESLVLYSDGITEAQDPVRR